MTDLAIIGGTGMTRLPELEITHREVVSTPYGEPSGPVTHGKLAGMEVAFMPRHGSGHTIAPHRVNYRANIWALAHINAANVVAVTAVGAIAHALRPGHIVFPDQLIDYTHNREHTFNEDDSQRAKHIDFTEPYDSTLRQRLIKAAQSVGGDYIEQGTYGVMQGPRLETAAEVNRLERDGCDMVGMTGMPEAALARELGLAYAACALVTNAAAGRSSDTVATQVGAALEDGLKHVRALLAQVAKLKPL